LHKVPTRKLYRVFPWLASAAVDDPGGALYVPAQGAGRFDNPGNYEILYLAESPEAAIAEAFGRHPLWTPSMLAGIPALKSSAHALASVELHDVARLCDLDDARTLARLRLRPSDVVNRDYSVTQAAALRIFTSLPVVGLRWWSFYNPAWGSVGIWDRAALGAVNVQALSITDAAVSAAASTILRMIQP
jgi:hypothetical protein